MSLAVFFRSETKKKCIPACCAAGREGDSRINSIKKLMTLSIADMESSAAKQLRKAKWKSLLRIKT
jgi:hypothetical protein